MAVAPDFPRLVLCGDASTLRCYVPVRCTRQGGVAMSTMAHLRSVTWPVHQQLEKRIDVKRRFASHTAYLRHLEKMWGFCAGLESRIDDELFADALPDYGQRRKLRLLSSDLAALGVAPLAIGRLPRCESVPACPDTATAFGCAYVLEGATLGGRTLLPVVEARLGLSAGNGAAFLASYGTDVTAMWQSFGSALDRWCEDPARRDQAATAAVATFDSLGDWLADPVR